MWFWDWDGSGWEERKLRGLRTILRQENIFTDAAQWQQIKWAPKFNHIGLTESVSKLYGTNKSEEYGLSLVQDRWPCFLWQLLTSTPLSEVNDLLLRGAYIRGLGPRDPAPCLLNLSVAASAVLSFTHKRSLLLSLFTQYFITTL